MEQINIGIANLIMSNLLKESYYDDSLINEAKNTTSNFLDVVKNSPILQLEFKTINGIENKHIDNDILASRYIDNNIKLFEVYTKEELDKEHNKIKKFIKESEIDKINNDKIKLYKSIGTLIEESVSDYEVINVDKIHESFEYVLEYIKKPKLGVSENEDSDIINEEVIEIAVNKFNEKYNQLDEQDVSLFKRLVTSSDDEKKELFEEYKNKNLEILNKINEDNTSDKIRKTIDKINEMKINDDSIDSDIINLYELHKGII
ncbi:MAG: hypothetical protein ACOC33_03375 [bacterium]